MDFVKNVKNTFVFHPMGVILCGNVEKYIHNVVKYICLSGLYGYIKSRM